MATRWIDVMVICRPFAIGIRRVGVSRPWNNRKGLLSRSIPKVLSVSTCTITSGELPSQYPTSFTSRPIVVISRASDYQEQESVPRNIDPHRPSPRARVAGSWTATSSLSVAAERRTLMLALRAGRPVRGGPYLVIFTSWRRHV